MNRNLYSRRETKSLEQTNKYSRTDKLTNKLTKIREEKTKARTNERKHTNNLNKTNNQKEKKNRIKQNKIPTNPNTHKQTFAHTNIHTHSHTHSHPFPFGASDLRPRETLIRWHQDATFGTCIFPLEVTPGHARSRQGSSVDV